jgi:DNA/RNA endonuclease G (NUC1)
MEKVMPMKPLKAQQKSSSASSSDDDPVPTVSRTECKFYPEPSLPEMFQVKNVDYNRRGLSRGHLAPAQFHKASQEEMSETFNLNTNIVPQDMTMNACDWYRLESMTKKLSKEFEKGLWVMSGPAFVPQIDLETGQRYIRYELIGDRDVAVPTHMFKCLLGVAGDDRRYAACFLMPNEPIPEERPLVQYQVAPSYISRLTGLKVFPKAYEGGSSSMFSAAAAPPADLCRKFKCEGSYASFSKSFRNIGRVRAARSEVELKRVYVELFQSGLVDSGVEKELRAKITELGVKDTRSFHLQNP